MFVDAVVVRRKGVRDINGELAFHPDRTIGGIRGNRRSVRLTSRIV